MVSESADSACHELEFVFSAMRAAFFIGWLFISVGFTAALADLTLPLRHRYMQSFALTSNGVALVCAIVQIGITIYGGLCSKLPESFSFILPYILEFFFCVSVLTLLYAYYVSVYAFSARFRADKILFDNAAEKINV